MVLLHIAFTSHTGEEALHSSTSKSNEVALMKIVIVAILSRYLVIVIVATIAMLCYRDPGGSPYCAKTTLFCDNVVSK